MPVGNDTFISGEPPDVQLREDEEIDDDLPPGGVSVAGVAKRAQLVTLLLVETSRTTGSSSGNKFISTPRLKALADWLKDALAYIKTTSKNPFVSFTPAYSSNPFCKPS